MVMIIKVVINVLNLTSYVLVFGICLNNTEKFYKETQLLVQTLYLMMFMKSSR